MRIVAWARVSSREQKEGYSLDAQLRAMRDRAAKSGWTIVKEFVTAESAKRGADRLAFNAMLKWVKANAKRERLELRHAALEGVLDLLLREVVHRLILVGQEDGRC